MVISTLAGDVEEEFGTCVVLRDLPVGRRLD
jgi:hypothetical protein